MRTRISLLFLAGVLAMLNGCATTPVPQGYAGPTARLYDYAVMETKARAAVFYVAEVNDNRIETSLDATRAATYGKGFLLLMPVTIWRDVPAGTLKLKLEGRQAYGAPIQEIVMAGTMRSVTETVEVDLKPGVSYQVRGVLADGKDEIWIEVLGSNDRIAKKILAR